jgi:signal transduction histidine kinase
MFIAHTISTFQPLFKMCAARRLPLQRLAQANARVQELSRLKDGLFSMISHEMRTPASGVLGLGQLLIDLCPKSDTRTLYADLFTQSSDRLINLLNDVALLANLDSMAPPPVADCHFSDLLAAMQTVLPGVHVTLDDPAALTDMALKGSEPLLSSALKTVLLLATCFSVNKADVTLLCSFDAQHLHIRLDVDALLLSSEQVKDFFKLESSTRSSSPAEPLGLAPVVACQTLVARGGALSLVKGAGANGYLAASFLRTQASSPGGTA